ncbi:MAG: hypothetical protein Q4D85_08465 [Corynebacterium sp.]|uniref:hypothetical protein n=1 Tax=Corynebacterium sp. TaxID=1720 RepID=UPI0026DC9292|nr:hypothetical protein [Corynebacterium sp.]MDO5098779.1 hypothetical protein [Corynebacterium sp.]
MDHPENDLSSDADQSNRFRPQPTTFDELADTPDPLKEAEMNRKSTKQAITWALLTPIVTGIVAYILAWVARIQGGPLCDDGHATWICSRQAEIWWPAATSMVPIIATIGCGVIMYRKYLNYTRWRPWMGTFWFLVPFAMLWMVTVFQMSIVGH